MSSCVGNGRCTMKPPPSRVRWLLTMRTTLRVALAFRDGFMHPPEYGFDSLMGAGPRASRCAPPPVQADYSHAQHPGLPITHRIGTGSGLQLEPQPPCPRGTAVLVAE